MHAVNMHDERPSGVIYVGRPSPLGNPFKLTEYTREESIQKYRRWLWEHIQKRTPEIIQALQAIKEDSQLGCWCKPHACHADVIVRAWRYCKEQQII